MADEDLDALDRTFAAKLPSQLREDIGAAFSRVLSDDPSVKVPATRSFVSLLNIAFTLNKDTRYENVLKTYTLMSINAINAYRNDNWAGAAEMCYKVQDDLGFLVYCGYGTVDGKSFSIPVAIQHDKGVTKK